MMRSFKGKKIGLFEGGGDGGDTFLPSPPP